MQRKLLLPVLLVLLSAAGCSQSQEPLGDASWDALSVWQDVEEDLLGQYAYIERQDFDSKGYLERVGEHVSASTTPEEFRQRLHRATYAFTDPHLIVGPLSDDDFNILYTSSDIRVDEDARVQDVRAGSAADAAGVRPGWTLLAADGVVAADANQLVYGEYLSNFTVKQTAYALTLLANGRRTGTRALAFSTPSGDLSLKLASPRDYANAVAEMDAVDVRREQLGDRDVAIIRFINDLGSDSTVTAFDIAARENLDADGFVLDLRNTPSGGNTVVARAILGHFTQSVKPYQMHTIPAVERNVGVPRRFVEMVEPRSPYLPIDRTVVLGGTWTGSMGEGIVIGMDALGAHTVASDMGDLLGGLYNFDYADGSVRVDMGVEALFHVDGTPREDFVADTDLASADRDANGSDPALAAATAVLR